MKKDLTDYEKKVFDDLPKEADLNPALRKKIINKLKSDGMIYPDRVNKNWQLWTASMAASILFFITGFLVGKKSLNEKINPAFGYAILLYEDEQFIKGEPLARATEYRDWMLSVSSQGFYIKGQELSEESSVINLSGSDGRVLSGYFLMEANSLEEAVGLAETIPHVKYGGGVEVKKFVNR